MARYSQHVVPRDNKWAVRKTGSDRVTRKFDTKREAVQVARDLARKQKSVVYIYGSNGQISKRESYANDNQ